MQMYIIIHFLLGAFVTKFKMKKLHGTWLQAVIYSGVMSVCRLSEILNIFYRKDRKEKMIFVGKIIILAITEKG